VVVAPAPEKRGAAVIGTAETDDVQVVAFVGEGLGSTSGISTSSQEELRRDLLGGVHI
jgi:hypothetical protein